MWPRFLPTLEEVVSLKKQEAQALAEGGDVYDALIDDFEPDMTATELAVMFDHMRPRFGGLARSGPGATSPSRADRHV